VSDEILSRENLIVFNTPKPVGFHKEWCNEWRFWRCFSCKGNELYSL